MRSIAAMAGLSIAAVLSAAMSLLVSAAPSSRLSPGDQLEYAVTVELQQHHVSGKPHDKDIVTESSTQGTATFSVYSIAADGTALANVALNLQGTNAGQPATLQTATPGKILPDGQLRTRTQVGLGVSDALAAANTAIAEISTHGPLVVGKKWTNIAKTQFVNMSVTRLVNSRINFRGLAAYTVQSVGAGTLLRTADGRPASGDISIGGTTYYDVQERLFVGEAFRTLTIITAAGGTAHDDYSSTFNVVLNSWNHAAAAAPSTAPPEEEASPVASPAPQQTPPPLYATPYPPQAKSVQ